MVLLITLGGDDGYGRRRVGSPVQLMTKLWLVQRPN